MGLSCCRAISGWVWVWDWDLCAGLFYEHRFAMLKNTRRVHLTRRGSKDNSNSSSNNNKSDNNNNRSDSHNNNNSNFSKFPKLPLLPKKMRPLFSCQPYSSRFPPRYSVSQLHMWQNWNKISKLMETNSIRSHLMMIWCRCFNCHCIGWTERWFSDLVETEIYLVVKPVWHLLQRVYGFQCYPPPSWSAGKCFQKSVTEHLLSCLLCKRQQ